MNSEEYLIARGWKEPEYDNGPWSHPHHMVDDRARLFGLPEAAEAQLAEDRAMLAFVLSRSDVCLMWPAPQLGPSMYAGHEHVEVTLTPKEPR